MIADSPKTNVNRASIYKILSEFYQPPQENLTELCSVLKEKVDSLYPHLTKQLNHSNLEFHSLQIDFSRLFIGPYKLLSPPYGSIYLENKGQIMGESTMDALEMYQKHGLQIEGNRIPDHIGVELEFIYFLIMKDIENGTGNKNFFLGEQKIFFEQHLTRWVFSFTKLLWENAKTDFYKNLGAFTRDFIKAEYAWMNN